MSLDGYAIACVNGGIDNDDNDVPDGTGADFIPEIDEAFSLDGHSIGSNGFLVLYNDGDSNSLVPARTPELVVLALTPCSPRTPPS